MTTTEQPSLSPASVAEALRDGPFAEYSAAYERALIKNVERLRHGDAPGWLHAVERLPDIGASRVVLDGDPVSANAEIDDATAQQLADNLRLLSPWRKGPFRIATTDIDTEWRSNLKWHRIADAMAPLDGRSVLDIGGGNGYFSWRCAGRGARAVLNVDPTLLFYAQYLAINRYLACRQTAMLPLAFEALPQVMAFDTVLSMGVLYHRRSPLEHLERIGRHLRPGGELVLETLVVDGDETTLLVPAGRYAGMRNVWFLPSVDMLKIWLARVGYENIRCVDESVTTTGEQRPTEWMTFHSLANALDLADRSRTVEGHPAPRRAVVIAERKARG